MKLAVLTTHPCLQFPQLYKEFSRRLGKNFNVFMSSDGRYEFNLAYCRAGNLARSDYNKLVARPGLQGGSRFTRYFNPLLIIRIALFRPDYIICPVWDTPNFVLVFILCLFTSSKLCLAGDSTRDTFYSNSSRFIRSLKLMLFRIITRGSNSCFYRGVGSLGLYNLCGVPKHKLFYYPPAVEIPEINQPRVNSSHSFHLDCLEGLKDVRIYLYVGRLSKEKNLDFLIRCWNDVNLQDSVLVIIGDGPEKRTLMSLCNNQSSILFMGSLAKQDVYKWMYNSNYLILPSIFEPHGAVMREAYACSLPVIASTKVGACLDLKPEDHGGFCFSPIDEVELKLCLRSSRDRVPISTETKKMLLSTISKQETSMVVDNTLRFFASRS